MMNANKAKKSKVAKVATSKINHSVSPETLIALEDFRRNLSIQDRFSASRRRESLIFQ